MLEGYVRIRDDAPANISACVVFGLSLDDTNIGVTMYCMQPIADLVSYSNYTAVIDAPVCITTLPTALN